MIFDENTYEQFVDIELTQENLSLYEENYFSNNIEFTTPEWEFKFFYSLAKHFIDYYKQNTTPIKNVLFVSKDEYYKPIYYSLKAIDILSNKKMRFPLNDYIKRAYVNLGNYYANQYRNYEAIDCYNQALYYDPNFDMAIANRTLAFEKIECLHYYINNQQLLKYLTDTYNSIQPRKMEAGKYLFELKKRHYNNTLRKAKKHLNNIEIAEFASTTLSDLSNTYEDWCLKNRLYINPLNDMELVLEAKKDIFVETGLNISDYHLSLMKEIYREYIYYRRKVYDNKPLSSESEYREVISTFKNLFSLFDKIAYFLYLFFDIDLKEHEVTYLKVFNEKTKLNNGINLLDIHNTNLYALFWIKREYRVSDDKLNIQQYLSKETQKLNELRSKLEHRTSILNDDEQSTLIDKTVGLLKIIRRALLYLNALIFEESTPSLYFNEVRDTNLAYFPLINGEHLFN